MSTFLRLLLMCLMVFGTGTASAQFYFKILENDICAEYRVKDKGEKRLNGAYGLCNAYCNALKCASEDPRGSDEVCERIKERFTQRTEDPLPCDLPEGVCPCFEYFEDPEEQDDPDVPNLDDVFVFVEELLVCGTDENTSSGVVVDSFLNEASTECGNDVCTCTLFTTDGGPSVPEQTITSVDAATCRGYIDTFCGSTTDGTVTIQHLLEVMGRMRERYEDPESQR